MRRLACASGVELAVLRWAAALLLEPIGRNLTRCSSLRRSSSLISVALKPPPDGLVYSVLQPNSVLDGDLVRVFPHEYPDLNDLTTHRSGELV
jgi:hypothetical protein